MDQGLQQLNADQRLAAWTQRIADCRSSRRSVKSWCRENNISQRRPITIGRGSIFRLAQEQQVLEFAELHSVDFRSPAVASLEISGVSVQVYAGADEQTLRALLHALSSSGLILPLAPASAPGQALTSSNSFSRCSHSVYTTPARLSRCSADPEYAAARRLTAFPSSLPGLS